MKSRLLLFSLVSALPLTAADFQWDVNGNTAGLGGAGTWNTANTFWDATASGANDGTEVTTANTFTTADKAIFGGTGGAVSVGNDVSLNKLSVDTSGYSFTGSRITFGGTGATLTATTDFTIANEIRGNFTKDGTGVVTITGLILFNTVTVTDGTLIRQASGDNDSSASIVNGGLLILASTAINSTSSLTINNGTARFDGTNNVQIWDGGIITLNGGTLQQNGKNETVRGIVLNGGSITGTGTLTSATDTIDARSGSATPVLAGSVGLTKTTGGTVTLSGDNTFSGNVLISAGELQTSSTNNVRSLGANNVGRTITVASPAILKFLGNDTFGNAGSSPNPSLLISGTVTNVAGKINTLGNVTLTGGLLTNVGGNQGAYQSYSLAGSVTVNGALPSSITTTGTTFTGVHLGTNTSFIVNDATTSTATDLTISAPLINRNGDLGSSPGGLTKSGAGTLELTAANTYTGTTAVSAGTLLLSGSATLPSSAINVAGGALFDVSGLTSANFTVASGRSLSAGRTTAFAEDVKGNLTLDAGTTLRVAGTGTTAGTLTQTGNLTLNNAFLNVDLTNATTTGSGVNDFISITGNLTLTGTSSITVNKLTPALTSGTYTLATCSGTLTGDAATNLTLVGLPDTARQTFELATTFNSIELVVTGIAANLVWDGNDPIDPTVWDIETTVNWTGADGKFADSDLVLFDDTASSTSVNLDVFVEPGSVTFNNSVAKPYTLTGAGSIAGVTGLVKNGNGIVTLATENDFSGAVSINSGTISIDSVTNSGAFGRLGTGNLVNLGGASDTGTLVFTGGTTSFNRAITVGAGGGVLQLDTAASLFTQTGTVTLNGTLAKSGPGDLTISTPVSGTGGITVNDGILTLPVANTFTGNVLVSGGELRTGTINNRRYLGSDGPGRSVTIAGGAILTLDANDVLGSAASAPATGLVVSGTLASTGKFNVLGNLTLSGGSLVATAGFSPGYQAFSLAGTVSVAGASASTISSTGTFNGTHLGTNTSFIVGDATGSAAPDLSISSPLLDRNLDQGGTGGITKTGDGTMLLTGINTFSGNTTVNGGTLELASGGALRFVVNNTTSNKISGTGAVTINGAFNIETGTVTNTTGSWTLVDAATLTENFGTFTINGIGWTETANVWTRIDGLKLWTFTEATGVLTLAPGNTFSSWMAGFTFEPGADTTPTGDADGDGISNLIENVFGTAPNAATTGINQVSSSTPGTLVFKHPVNTSLASNVTYTYSWSTDLSEWKASGESNTGGTSVSIGAVTAGAEATVTAIVTPSDAEKVFVRIEASVAP